MSREHEIFARPDGIVIIAGGKLTTYRRMARQAVDAAVALLTELGTPLSTTRTTTKDRPLPGAVGVEPPELEGVAVVGRLLMTEHGLDVDTATHLCGVYGARAPVLGAAIAANRALGQRIDPELPYVWAEIEFAARHDLARTVEDVLARRVPLLLVSRDQGLGACERVADVLAGIHAWDATTRASMIAEYRAEVALSRRWREPDVSQRRSVTLNVMRSSLFTRSGGRTAPACRGVDRRHAVGPGDAAVAAEERLVGGAMHVLEPREQPRARPVVERRRRAADDELAGVRPRVRRADRELRRQRLGLVGEEVDAHAGLLPLARSTRCDARAKMPPIQPDGASPRCS